LTAPEEPQAHGLIGRRSLLLGGAAAAAGVGAAYAWQNWQSEPEDAVGGATVSFHGQRQAGVATPAQAHLTLIAFDLREGVDREALSRLMQIWTIDAARLTAGKPGLVDTEPELAHVPASLTLTVGLGPGFFTAADREADRPAWLEPLPAFGIDRLETQWTGGDLVLQVCANDPITVAHAARVMSKEARSFTTIRWVQHGFRHSPGSTPPGTTMRNLFGQIDGTVNPDPREEEDLIWHPDGTEPAWMAGATSMVVRRIAMDMDGWDEAGRHAREVSIGRRLSDGAPLTGEHEHDDPDFDAIGPHGFPVIETFSHIRRARSDNPNERFLRRSYNYDQPAPPGEVSDSGMVFITFQADPVAQFVPIQQRLDELDLLNEWTVPIGSAVFLIPPGAAQGEYMCQRLLT